MGAIVIKSKNKVPNLDAINEKDAYAIIELRKFDSLYYTGLIVYKRVIEKDDGEGNITESHVIDSKKEISYTTEEINQLFVFTELSIPSGENYDEKNRQIITTAFLYKIGQDEAYGLSMNDWDVMTS